MQQDNTTTAEYTYDANGNLTKDQNKGILSITYNYLNLPASITKTGGTRIEYSYDAAGTKRQQRYYLDGTLTKTTDFYTNFVYENWAPAWVTYDEGRVVLNSNGTANVNEAYLKDHLGNIRVVYYLQAGVLKTQQVNSYYPFGMNIKGLTADGSTPYPTYKKNEYLYNGKMMQDEMGLGWLDYGARMYDAALGRFHVPDPKAEERSWTSPFSYCQNNPISRIDEDGMLDTDFGIDENGNIKQIGPTNKEPDKLYATNNKGEKKDTNGDKKVDANDAVTVQDKSILPELSKAGLNINKASTPNNNDAANIFKFAADNSKVEWIVFKYSGDKGADKFMIATWHSPDVAPGSSTLGIPESSIRGTIHSHPGILTDYDSERQSMGVESYGQAEGDLGNSNQRMQNNGMKEPYPSLVYFPNSGNLWKAGPGQNTKLERRLKLAIPKPN